MRDATETDERRPVTARNGRLATGAARRHAARARGGDEEEVQADGRLTKGLGLKQRGSGATENRDRKSVV